MEAHLFSANLILKLSDYLGTRDVYNIGGVSKIARQKIRKNTGLWKAIVTRRCPCELWSQVSLDDDDFVIIAVREELELERALRIYHVLYRLEQPMSSRDALRVFLEITTPGLPAPYDKVIIPGTLLSPGETVSKTVGEGETAQIERKRKPAEFIFKRNDGKSFHVWYENGDHNSLTRFYTIDRRNPQLAATDAKDRFRKCQVGWPHENKTILSKDDYDLINRILKLDIPKEDKGKIVRKRDASGEQEPVAVPTQNANDNSRADGIEALLIRNIFAGSALRARDPKVYAYTSWTLNVDLELWFGELHFANPLFDSKAGVGLSKSTDNLEGSTGK